MGEECLDIASHGMRFKMDMHLREWMKWSKLDDYRPIYRIHVKLKPVKKKYLIEQPTHILDKLNWMG